MIETEIIHWTISSILQTSIKNQREKERLWKRKQNLREECLPSQQ